MATIINNPRPADERTFVESDSTGWIAATIILLALIAGGIYMWMHYRRGAAVTPTPTPGATINLTLPEGSNGNGNNGSTGGTNSSAGQKTNTNAGASY
jgi:hypothetical protein